MKRRGVLLVFYLIFSLLIIHNSNASYYYNGNILERTIGLIGFNELGSIYTKNSAGFAIDFFIVLAIFIYISVFVFKQKFGKGLGITIGILLSFIFMRYETQNDFYFGDLGPLAPLILVILFAAGIYWLFHKWNRKFDGFIISYVIVWGVASVLIPDPARKAFANGLIWDLFDLIGGLLLIIGVIMLFTRIFRGSRHSFPTGTNVKDATQNLLSLGTGAWEGTKDLREKYAKMRDSGKLRRVMSDIHSLDKLISNIDAKITTLNVALLQNDNDRLNIITQIEAYIKIIAGINIKLKSKDPALIGNIQDVQQKYKEAQQRLDNLILTFYNLLVQATNNIKQQRKLEEQEINLLGAETKKQINDQGKIFKSLYDILHRLKDPSLKNKEIEIQKLRNQIANTLNDIRKLINPKRIEMYKTLQQLNSQDIRLTSQLQQTAKKGDYNQALIITRNLASNLGTEISISRADDLKNKNIADLRLQLISQDNVLRALSDEIYQAFEKAWGITSRP